MTIAIAVCLSDGALLISDGLRVNPIQNNRVLSTDARKISAISSSMAAIELGVSQGTSLALRAVNRTVLDHAGTVSTTVSEIDRAVHFGWNVLLSSLGGDIDRNHPSIKVALVFRGYVPAFSQGGLIGGSLYHIDGHDETLIRTQENHIIVLGGEGQNAQSRYKELAQSEMNSLSSQGVGVRDNVVDAFIRAATITWRRCFKFF
jgi:hypothetical protein